MGINIKLLVMDVDGTLTDGKLHISESGELFKSFDSKDGYALKVLLRDKGIIPVIMTGRESKIVEIRAKELGITEVYQNIADKAMALQAVAEKYDISLGETAFIGDDLNDLTAMTICGLSACPTNAADEVKAAVDYVCIRDGGNGAVREFVDWIICNDQRSTPC